MDKLAKIRSLLNILVTAWQAAYYPNREICLDESMIAFKGRTGAMFYQPKKPHKWGMQAWFLVDSRTAYCYNLNIYSGGIPAARLSTPQARGRYTGGTVLNATGQKPVYRICFLMRTGTGMPKS